MIAFGSSATTVNLVWTSAAGATSYILERQTGGGAFATVQTLDTSATSFLDRNLTAQTSYTYRLTGVGATQDQIREHGAATDNFQPLQTTGDAPVGAPVQQTVGSAGGTVASPDGTISLVVPAGALPDGTNVTLQTIQNPLTQEDAPGVSIFSDTAFAVPVSLSFQLGSDDLPQTASIALQDTGGLWLNAPVMVDTTAGTVTVTLDVEASRSAMINAATTPRTRRALKYKRYYVNPRKATVRTGSQTNFEADALLSTDRCNASSSPETCAYVVELVRLAQQGVQQAIADAVTQPLPQQMSVSVPNSAGIWSLEPVGNASGKLTVPAQGASVLYTAPDTKPSTTPVLIKFTPNSQPGQAPLYSDPGKIYFLGNKYQVDGEFSAPGYNLNEFITANVTDSFSVQLELTTSPGGFPIVNTSQFQNGQSNYTSAACPDPDVTAFELSGTFEVITADSSNAGYANKILSLELDGISVEPGVTLHFGPTITQTFPGGTSSTSVFIEVPVDLESLTQATRVEATSVPWVLTISPLTQ